APQEAAKAAESSKLRLLQPLRARMPLSTLRNHIGRQPTTARLFRPLYKTECLCFAPVQSYRTFEVRRIQEDAGPEIHRHQGRGAEPCLRSGVFCQADPMMEG